MAWLLPVWCNPERHPEEGRRAPGDRPGADEGARHGVITDGHKRGRGGPGDLASAVGQHAAPERAASTAAQATPGVHALTDITGFGLLGHTHEMAHLSGIGLLAGIRGPAVAGGGAALCRGRSVPGRFGAKRGVLCRLGEPGARAGAERLGSSACSTTRRPRADCSSRSLRNNWLILSTDCTPPARPRT
jgi:hypothetical protein